jgi:class 3 adenylate cyclase
MTGVQPETRYATTGGLSIGYQVVGEGPIDVVLVDQWFSNVVGLWRFAPLAEFVERLATFSRVILLDKRGTGISDPVPLGGLPTLDEWMDDIRAVLDAVGSERTVLLSGAGASYLTILFAATYPDRASALILVDGYARISSATGYLPGLLAHLPPEDAERLGGGWGRGALLDMLAPDEAADAAVRRTYSEYESLAASPSVAVAMIRMLYESDVRHVLPAVRIPTLIICHLGSARIPPTLSRYMAERIPGAKLAELPGTPSLIWAGDQNAVLGDIQEFLTGIRPQTEADRVLATVLFTDIVDSTSRAAELGDNRWRHLLEAHRALVRAELARFRGREIDTTGDGFLATFDGPARAIRCAVAITVAIRSLGLEIRAGLHTGEIELMGNNVGGIAVHIGARVASLAGPGEVVVSSTVKDLVAGSGIEFIDRGMRSLKGVPGEWRLLAVRV